ncbi:helix-turn-helix transcriptional regulator [uncultured Amnibacterium sp.]|uniref:helix-turn-helix transcriptional regulator n=1 Tax=uncultured Amnibacterium sp. TaxID=1631851 RepID=UPI0035CC90A8
MPVASSPSTSKRLLALLSLLQSRRDWPAHLLATRLEVSERTVRRDVDRLRQLDYAIDATRGPDGGYRLGAGASLPPLLLDDEQAVAIGIALRVAGALGAGLEEAAERALATITRTLPSRLAARIEALEPAAAGTDRTRRDDADPAVLLRIGEAIRAGEELRFDYVSPIAPVDPSSPPPVRRTEPHHLLLRGGRWYLIGYAADRDDWRVYRVDRIAPRTHRGRRFARRAVPGGDPARYLAARFTGSTDGDTWPCWGEAVLAAPIAGVAPYVADGTAEAVDDERSRVGLGAWSWAALAAAFARFDADVSEVEPPQLVEAFGELARRAAAALPHDDEGAGPASPPARPPRAAARLS